MVGWQSLVLWFLSAYNYLSPTSFSSFFFQFTAPLFASILFPFYFFLQQQQLTGFFEHPLHRSGTLL
ncbi:predicted protein [Lichtheimia corymbifera JMRC:FSU:9682]|uniref:Uncharacterized protein n=1 Tax=Lichtheimia corymbifera JMRC:FSU:9682 TaxID=1263082 RepID=A0A068SEF7_9FUNG|nr:predicted protein [Lichtheimia corymbifera JMRC:FSU:9682]